MNTMMEDGLVMLKRVVKLMIAVDPNSQTGLSLKLIDVIDLCNDCNWEEAGAEMFGLGVAMLDGVVAAVKQRAQAVISSGVFPLADVVIVRVAALEAIVDAVKAGHIIKSKAPDAIIEKVIELAAALCQKPYEHIEVELKV